jgi:tetratricopeptide (TPR) repeat protein
LKKIDSIGILALALLMFLGLACSTKKNTFTRRAYHNLTAHYNAYFNGKEAYNEGVGELAKRCKDNFNKVIPVFQYGTKEDAQSQYALFDRAIEKGSIVIHRHSIYIKRVEHVKWIDDAYFLIGKSYLYKQEYDLAVQTFSFIRDRYKGNPIVYDAILYQLRTYSQLGRFTDGEALISLVDKKIEKNKATKHIEKLFPLVMADYYLQQSKYDRSIEYLKEAYRLNRSKKIRTRISFILAQVFQRTGDLARATENYRKVLNYNPVYEMAFAAKINIAKCYDAASGDSKEIKKTLKKMLNDEKNKDFRDQIYYALAEVFLKEGNDSAAIRNLRLSAHSSVSNNYQKGLSYLKLGDLYYGYTSYKPAQMYYDSAVQSLPKDYPTYALLESKTNTLTELVKNINIVELEDSLQRLGKLPYNERMAEIDKIIADIRKAEERKRQEEIDRQNNQMNLQQMGFQNPQNQNGGLWYFYNPKK